MKSSIWDIDGILKSTPTLAQRGPGSNSNEGAFHIPQTPGWSLTIKCSLALYPRHLKSCFSQCYWPSPTTFKIKKMGICLSEEQFEEYSWDNHRGTRVWDDQPTDRFGLLWLPF